MTLTNYTNLNVLRDCLKMFGQYLIKFDRKYWSKLTEFKSVIKFNLVKIDPVTEFTYNVTEFMVKFDQICLERFLVIKIS